MPKRFTRAIYAASAVVVAASSLALSAGAANAETHAPRGTAACSFSCVNFFNQQLGSNTTMNAFVPGDTGVGGKVGQKVNLHLAGNFRPNGDFAYLVNGFVFQFCGFLANDFFSPTSYVCVHFPFAPVIELAWTPFGNQTNFCAGVARPGVSGQSVTLQTCGKSANTVWIGDTIHGTGGSCTTPVPSFARPVPPGASGSVVVHFCPWINGGDNSFSQPLVLTLNTGTQNPTNQLMINPETLVGFPAVARSDQQFSTFIGPV